MVRDLDCRVCRRVCRRLDSRDGRPSGSTSGSFDDRLYRRGAGLLGDLPHPCKDDQVDVHRVLLEARQRDYAAVM